MNIYSKLAKSAVEQYVRHHNMLPLPPVVPAELQRQCACYIYILENPGKHLRALYGEPLPRQSTLAQEIITNTVRALEHPNTRPIRRAELPSLAYTVAVLEPPQRISTPEHLDPLVFGLYVQTDRGKYALILPQRAGIETPHDQIATAVREARINPREEIMTLYRLKVTYHES